jgi:hypothetical protein
MMSLVYYSIKTEDAGKRILKLIKNSLLEEKTKVSRTLLGLASYLKNFPSPETVLLLVADLEELASLLSLKKFFRNSRLIIILPDRSETALRLSLALSPALLCFQDSDFLDVVNLLVRTRRERQNRIDEVDPKRYLWTGTVPYLLSLPMIEDNENLRLPEKLPYPA